MQKSFQDSLLLPSFPQVQLHKAQMVNCNFLGWGVVGSEQATGKTGEGPGGDSDPFGSLPFLFLFLLEGLSPQG